MGGRKPKKNKARHGLDFSRDTRGDPGRPPRSASPHRTFDEREPSSYVAMADTPEDPEEQNAVPPPPSPPDESDHDMEEASVSSTDSSMPGLVTDSNSDGEPDGEEICRHIRIRRPPRNLPTIQAATRVSVDIFPSLPSTIFTQRPRLVVDTDDEDRVVGNPGNLPPDQVNF
jgi:hypothetical protein